MAVYKKAGVKFLSKGSNPSLEKNLSLEISAVGVSLTQPNRRISLKYK